VVKPEWDMPAAFPGSPWPWGVTAVGSHLLGLILPSAEIHLPWGKTPSVP